MPPLRLKPGIGFLAIAASENWRMKGIGCGDRI